MAAPLDHPRKSERDATNSIQDWAPHIPERRTGRDPENGATSASRAVCEGINRNSTSRTHMDLWVRNDTIQARVPELRATADPGSVLGAGQYQPLPGDSRALRSFRPSSGIGLEPDQALDPKIKGLTCTFSCSGGRI